MMDDNTGEPKKTLQPMSEFTAGESGDPRLRNDLASKEALSSSVWSVSLPSEEMGSGEEEEGEEEEEMVVVERPERPEAESLDNSCTESPQVQVHPNDANDIEDNSEAREGGEYPQEDGEGDEDSEKDETGEMEGDIDDEHQRKEAGKEPRMNGESGSRNSGSGKRWRSRNSGSASTGGDQPYTTPSSSLYKPSLSSSGGGRHKQARRRNHHHHQGRARRQTGSQLIMAVKEILSESISPWCMSCIHMVVELIVSVAHHCGVAVESGSLALYDLSSRFLFRVTDLPGLKQDARRAFVWTRCTGAALVAWTSRLTSRVWQASTSCFSLFCAIVMLATRWAKCSLGRLSGGRAQQWWETLQNSWVWKKAAALFERCRGLFRRTGSQGAGYSPESPSGGRGQPGQELERLLSLAQVPEEELDPFTVLGVEPNATENELKRAYRQLAVQVS